MRTVFFLLLLASVAHAAESSRIYGKDGSYKGYTVERPKGETRAYSKDGKFEGRSVQRPDGSSRIYNAQGKLVGTTKPRK